MAILQVKKDQRSHRGVGVRPVAIYNDTSRPVPVTKAHLHLFVFSWMLHDSCFSYHAIRAATNNTPVFLCLVFTVLLVEAKLVELRSCIISLLLAVRERMCVY